MINIGLISEFKKHPDGLTSYVTSWHRINLSFRNSDTLLQWWIRLWSNKNQEGAKC